jgi:DNA-binding NarL/FixJ family response regulator
MKIKVLMVDDHALFRDGMRYVLQQLADEVEVIDSGNFVDGMKQAANNPDIDLALLDLNMPGSDGSKIHSYFSRKQSRYSPGSCLRLRPA